MAISLNNCPASSCKNTIGKNTAIVVRAEAINAPQTSLAPTYAASEILIPSFLCLSIFSKTTIAESTSIPTAKEIPAREIVFKLLPIASNIIKVPIIEIGIATETTAVGEIALKKIIRIRTAKIPPIIIFCLTKSTEPTIYGL